VSARQRIARRSIDVRGVVQGVGFRPFVHQLARSLGLVGWIRNGTGNVAVEIQGPAERIAEFLHRLRREPPSAAVLDAIATRPLPVADDETTFEIRESAPTRGALAKIPADRAPCPTCVAEILSTTDRRHRHAFASCTDCGPRFSIIEAVPYDRTRTTMAKFPPCRACAAEYADPTDRRFHAEPIACPRCGPVLSLVDPAGQRLANADAAIAAAADALRRGRILAVKGIGGFQLVVDATDGGAVARLRARKHRHDKPLALLVPTIGTAREVCVVSDAEARALAGPEAPIVLLNRRRPDMSPERAASRYAGTAGRIADEVAPKNPTLGVMLPASPLHHLLVRAAGRPLVCTSGNLSEEPIAITLADALDRLGSIADAFLSHDRDIVRPVDDSVLRVDGATRRLVRRARGFTPHAIALAHDGPTVLAVGAHLKNTVALAIGREAILSQHHGDLTIAASIDVFERSVADLLAFHAARPTIVACDLHPDYASTRIAERAARTWNTPLVRVQHHHAHVAAAMAEHGLAGPVLGIAWDGAGYGTDATVWGGEALVCRAGAAERVAHLRPFPLPGAGRAIIEPRRAALGLLWAHSGDAAVAPIAHLFDTGELGPLLVMLRGGVNSPSTTSVGRLFDAVAAITGLATHASFEGQAAMALEYAIDPECEEAYPLPLIQTAPAIGDWGPLLEAVVADVADHVPVARISARFHNALVAFVVAVARHLAIPTVVLTGGCFQNRYLLGRLETRLGNAGFTAVTPESVPPNDGGIALGQVYVARMSR
jgi:hydrogenase maturation protein HypF